MVEETLATAERRKPGPVPRSELDFALTSQILVAWAGEGGEEPRLGWWRSDLVSEYGGEDLFRHLLPATWQWATLQAAREAARRRDLALRSEFHAPDRLVSLFHLGFAWDEAIEDRLQELKRSGKAPTDGLPELNHLLSESWDSHTFSEWVAGHGSVNTVPSPTGRRLKGPAPGSLERTVRSLVAALAPLAETYPLPFFQKP